MLARKSTAVRREGQWKDEARRGSLESSRTSLVSFKDNIVIGGRGEGPFALVVRCSTVRRQAATAESRGARRGFATASASARVEAEAQAEAPICACGSATPRLGPPGPGPVPRRQRFRSNAKVLCCCPRARVCQTCPWPSLGQGHGQGLGCQKC